LFSLFSFIRLFVATCIHQQPNITFGASSKNQFNEHEFKKKQFLPFFGLRHFVA